MGKKDKGEADAGTGAPESGRARGACAGAGHICGARRAVLRPCTRAPDAPPPPAPAACSGRGGRAGALQRPPRWRPG